MSLKINNFGNINLHWEIIVKKHIILSLFLLALPIVASAQKIVLGSCVTHDGGQYKGQMQSGKPYGKGLTVFKNGDTYEGEYVKGRRQGQGIYTFSDGEKYEGEWFQDQQHDNGTYYFMNNNKYVGLWFRDYSKAMA